MTGVDAEREKGKHVILVAAIKANVQMLHLIQIYQI